MVAHLALGAATFVPVAGSAFALADATLYTAEGDYLDASLSMLAVVPGGELLSDGAKLARGGEKALTAGEDVARLGEDVARGGQDLARAGEDVASSQRTSSLLVDPASRRVALRQSTKQEIMDRAPRTSNGDFIDPNTGQALPQEGPFDFGHRPGYEWRSTRDKARAEGWNRQDVIEYENDPSHYQIEDPSANRSHRYEA